MSTRRVMYSVIAMARSLRVYLQASKVEVFLDNRLLALYRGSASIISKGPCQRAGDSRSLIVEIVSAGACVLELSLLEILCPGAPCRHASLPRPPRRGPTRL